MKEVTTIGLDLAKSVFQVHGALVHDSAVAGMEGGCFVREGSSMPHKFNAKRRHKFAKAR